MIDLEIDDEPYTEQDLERLAAIGRESERTGEFWMKKAWCEGEIKKLQSKRAKLLAAIKAKPNDPKIPRAVAVIADMDVGLQVLREMRLRAWPTDRRFSN